MGGADEGKAWSYFVSMRLEKYFLKSEETLTVFEFISEGQRGAIRKLIHFQPTSTPGLYNLAFGDKHPETGEIDDLAVSNNGDTDKVLATIVGAVYAFFERHPDAAVYATGSTSARTRLYRMGITRFYDEMLEDFYLFGETEEGLERFQLDKDYYGFLAQRKFE